MNFIWSWAWAPLFAAGVLLASPANSAGQSVPGITEKEIVIGSCAALQGP